ncbi:MAG: deoxynucleoside kinase [Rikenellaceae bacterium]|nr:deoxynucleoside kinase [Rikenellaceae bacterium]
MTLKSQNLYIAVAGNIGSGKTSLTQLLSERCNARVYAEDINNPYLGDFYEDMNRWAFNLQIYFLGSRIRQAVEILSISEDLIQDRTVYEDAHIFAANLHEMGLMSSRDYDSYMRIFEIAAHLIPVPDLLIYLKASVPTLINQIRKRGRDYEMSIEEGYLCRLNEKYDNWIENIYTGEVITIDMDTEDFISDPSTIDMVVARIEEIRAGKYGGR